MGSFIYDRSKQEAMIGKQKVVFCTPTLTRPFPQYLDALEASIPSVIAAGWEEAAVFEVGMPYIACARATMLRKALDAKADVVVFIDHDLSWDPGDLVKLLETEGEVVAGTYRYKCDSEERYMGTISTDDDHRPVTREDGCIAAEMVPAGFMKMTKDAVDRFMRAHPELTYGPRYNASTDLFNHGVIDGVWLGEDVAFCKRWRKLGGEIWIVPNLNVDHHSPVKSFPGNFHHFLLSQPGGSEASKGITNGHCA
jgi:hypothetical protein